MLGRRTALFYFADYQLIIPITQITVRNAIRVGLQEIPFFVHTFQPVDEFMFFFQRVGQV